MKTERGIAVRSGRVAAVVCAVAMVGIGGCAKPQVAVLYPQVAEYDGREIAEVSFRNPEPFSADSLDRLTETEETRCALLGVLPFCFRGIGWGYSVGRLDMRTVGSDLSRLTALYRRAGYFGTAVVPQIDEVTDGDDAIHVRFMVRRGDGIVVDSVVVQGTEGIADPDSLEAELPLQPGELLDLNEFLASADTVGSALRRRGHAYAEVLRNYSVDTIQDRATIWLLAVPGPRVVVDSVIVDGMVGLSQTDVRRQLTFESGDLLRLRDLRESQRNLYELELVRFASVAVAADSLQLTPEDSTSGTVRVALDEAPEHVVETELGYGSVECFRVRGQWTDRSVFGGGRKLRLTGALSRIGLGSPLGGLENSICGRGEDEEIADQLDYSAVADFTQLYFMSPRNQLGVTLFSERQSVPGLLQRTASGIRTNVTRRIRQREVLNGGLSAEYRITQATRALYCVEFRACRSEDVERFLQGRFRNAVNASWIQDRANSVVDPTAGHLLRSSATWSTSLLGSDFDFVRAELEGSLYHPVGRGVVLAGFARLGSFIPGIPGAQDFVPPDERFFAGGASSVRGYTRFTLGPGLYILRNEVADPNSFDVSRPDTLQADFIPTGGKSVSTLSAEARFPSPWLRDVLRLAVFVDAGTVGRDPVWKLSSQWRVTPGAGLRIQTPVGPIRVDVGYNPYPAPVAPLFAPVGGGDLVRILDDFQGGDRGRLDRLTLHIAVGQAF